MEVGRGKQGTRTPPPSLPPTTMKDFRPGCNQPFTLMIEKITF